ncbi:hypothetical protein GQ44DRAFT_629532, partial [Phaeosphaeriaceae sp. PMI808]
NFSLSIAGHFDLDVYILTMSSLNNHSLKTLFAELPQHCIVLLEDVDAAGVNRTQDSNMNADRSLGQNGPRISAEGKVSLSTLLNVLDGLASPEGRLLIMTTNHIERLDPALIRPGRVDTKVNFQLFFFVYRPQSKTISSGNVSEQCICHAGEESVIDCELPQLAQEFVAKVPKLEFSPAEIMSLCWRTSNHPAMLLLVWISGCRGSEKKGQI